MKYARKHKTRKTSNEVEWLSIMWRHIFPLCWKRSRQPVSYPVFLLSMTHLWPVAFVFFLATLTPYANLSAFGFHDLFQMNCYQEWSLSSLCHRSTLKCALSMKPNIMVRHNVIYIGAWQARDIPLGFACTRHVFDTSGAPPAREARVGGAP